jgi:hypothetical protein
MVKINASPDGTDGALTWYMRWHMKKAIELLERAKAELVILRYKGGWITPCKFIRAAFNYINEAIALLRSPRWETPEQYEKRTGEKLSDNAPVWFKLSSWKSWNILLYKEVPTGKPKKSKGEKIIVIVHDIEMPPDDWKPEATE